MTKVKEQIKESSVATDATDKQEKTLIREQSKTSNADAGKREETQNTRILSIDRFRGFAIFCMIFFQLAGNFDNLGFLSRIANHSVTDGIVLFPGMTIADIIAPMFMFAIGLTYILSFKKRAERDGKAKTYVHFALRYLALIGLGTALQSINKIIGAFDGDALAAVDYVFISFFALILLAGILYLIFSIPQIKKYRSYLSKAFLYVLALTGVVTLMALIRDFAVLSENPTNHTFGYWFILQSIGLPGLITLFVIDKNIWKRLLWTVGFFTVFTIYHEAGNQAVVDAMTHGGLMGGLAWTTILLVGTIIAELYSKNKNSLYICTGILAPIAIASFFIFGINPGSISPGFVIITATLCSIIFIVFELFNFLKLKHFDFLAIWGKNPLLLYILEFALIGSIVKLCPDSLIEQAPVWLALIWLIGLTAVLTGIAYLLHRKKKVIKL